MRMVHRFSGWWMNPENVKKTEMPGLFQLENGILEDNVLIKKCRIYQNYKHGIL